MGQKDRERYLGIFRGSMLAEGMAEADMRSFLASSRVRLMALPKGGIVLHDGDVPQCLYVLLSGEVHIQKDTFSGRQIFLSEIDEPGDVFGEVYLLLGKPYDMYVEAVRDTELLAIQSEAFSLEAAAPAGRLVQRNLMRILARKAYFMHGKLKVLASGSLRERIARFLFWQMDREGVVRLAVSRTYLAEYLAVARPSLSRELSNMQREGILAVEGKKISVLDRERFEAYL